MTTIDRGTLGPPGWTREATVKAVVLTVFMYGLVAIARGAIHLYGHGLGDRITARDVGVTVLFALLTPIMVVWTVAPGRTRRESWFGLIQCLLITGWGAVSTDLISALIVANFLSILSLSAKKG
ncbi:MAG: hypothetical protein D6692_08600 [Planctomycetota bacterium]|nr:MAG: hypothetical protein D6692_08600 [Planctomycetota bacterium]